MQKLERKRNLRKLYYWLVGCRNRYNYWSCSKFADFITRKTGGLTKPTAASCEDWSTWHKSAKLKSRIGYYVTETLLNQIQDVVYFPYDMTHNVRVYIVNRYVDQIHVLQTGLDKGKWFDVDTRLLHGMFETLVNFVDVEKAAMWDVSSSNETSDSNKGIAYLKWEIALQSENQHQSDTAAEILRLYNWWTADRPNRPSAHKASGLDDYNDKEDDDDDSLDIFAGFNNTDPEYKRMLDAMSTIEAQYDDDDTDNMIKLIKLRGGLWS